MFQHLLLDLFYSDSVVALRDYCYYIFLFLGKLCCECKYWRGAFNLHGLWGDLATQVLVMPFGVTEIQDSSVISKQDITECVDTFKQHVAVRNTVLCFQSAFLIVTIYCALAQNMGRTKNIQPCFLPDNVNLKELFFSLFFPCKLLTQALTLAESL